MNLEDLKTLGVIVSSAPVKQEITWTQADAEGEAQTHTGSIFVKVLAYGDYEKLLLQPSEDDEKSRQVKLMVAALRFGDKGKECPTYEDAYQFTPSFANACLNAINLVNSSKKKVKPDGRVLARDGVERNRWQDDSGSEVESVPSGSSGLDGVLPASGNTESKQKD